MAAEISISGVKKVKTLQREFKEGFNLTLRIYNGKKFADPEATIASIKEPGVKGGDIKIVGNTKVGNLEDKFKELYGITVQVASADDSKLVSNDLTLAAAAKV
ncbi:MAG: hypothetical protein WCG93_05665 [Paludibacter sp.]